MLTCPNQFLLDWDIGPVVFGADWLWNIIVLYLLFLFISSYFLFIIGLIDWLIFGA
jgi:hypothetical protein